MKRRRWLWGILIGLGVILLAGGVWLYNFSPYFDYKRAAAMLPAQLAEAKKLGVPLTADDLPKKKVADKDNAGPLLHELDMAWRKGRFFKEVLAGVNSPRASEMKMARSEFSRARAFLDLATRAADRPQCDFKRDWSNAGLSVADMDASTLESRTSAHVKVAVEAIGSRAVLAGIDKRPDASIADIRRAAKLSEHVGAEPEIISMLVRFTCEQSTLVSAQRLAERLTKADDLRKLKQVVEKSFKPIRVIDYMPVEVLMKLKVAKDLADAPSPNQIRKYLGPGEGGPPPSKIKHYVRRTTSGKIASEAYTARTLEFWNAVYRLGEDRFNNLELEKVILSVDKAVQSSNDLSQELGQSSQEHLSSLFDSLYRREAAKQLTLALLDVLIYKAENGRLPGSLAKAQADEYRDPFKPGSELGYEFSRNRVKLWSIGPDRHDDGGYFKSGDLQRRDLVVSYPCEKKPFTAYTYQAIERRKTPGAAPRFSGS